MADSRCQRRKQSHPKRKNVDLENMPDDPEAEAQSAMRSSLSPSHPSQSTEMAVGDTAKGGPTEESYSSKLLSNCKIVDPKEQQQHHHHHPINGILPISNLALPSVVGHGGGEEEKIQEYLQRSDTAVIYPEPVGRLKDDTDGNNNEPNSRNEANNNSDNQREEVTASKKRRSINESDYLLKCPHCERVFTGNEAIRDLQEHLAGAHDTTTTSAKIPESTKSHPCNKCNATFADKDSLAKHKLFHTATEQGSTVNNADGKKENLRKFKCPECGKAFKFKHHLKEHIRIHSGEKPFACQNCGKRFSHSGSYSSHSTSKKCLVVNLKVRKVDSRSSRGRTAQNNSFRPIIPKYGVHSSSTATPASNELPIVPAPGYVPSSERYSSFLSSNRPPPQSYMPLSFHPLLTSAPPYMPIGSFPEVTQLLQHRLENEVSVITDEKSQSHIQISPLPSVDKIEERRDISESSPRGLNAVKKILEIVDATVKQQNQQSQQPSEKTRNGLLSELLSSGPQTISKSLSGGDAQPYDIHCRFCARPFDNKIDLHQHERYLCSLNSDLRNPKEVENLQEVEWSDGESSKGSSKEGHSKPSGVSILNGDNLVALKAHYQVNPRPKKSEMIRLSRDMKCSTRVVQAWFQSQQHDTGERMNGNSPGSPPALHSMSSPPFNSVIPRYNGALPSNAASLSPFRTASDLDSSKSIHSNNNNHEPDSDQPLDLSVKPKREDCESEALNLSQKSSRTGVSPPKDTSFQSNRLQLNQIHDYEIREASPQPHSSLLYKYMQLGMTTSVRSPKHDSFNPPLAAVTPSSPDRSPSHAEGPRILPSPDAASCAENCSSPSGTGGSYGHTDEPNDGDSFGPSVAKKLRIWHQGDVDDSTLDDIPGLEEDSSGGSGKARKSWKLHKVESEEGMYACDQCDKMFSKQSSLARHKYEHSGQRPHKCDVCNKAFKHKHHLTEHKRLHSGEKPFQCKKCLKRFSHSGSYSQHMNHRYSYCKPYHE